MQQKKAKKCQRKTNLKPLNKHIIKPPWKKHHQHPSTIKNQPKRSSAAPNCHQTAVKPAASCRRLRAIEALGAVWEPKAEGSGREWTRAKALPDALLFWFFFFWLWFLYVLVEFQKKHQKLNIALVEARDASLAYLDPVVESLEETWPWTFKEIFVVSFQSGVWCHVFVFFFALLAVL